jgi:hypothetical protein
VITTASSPYARCRDTEGVAYEFLERVGTIFHANAWLIRQGRSEEALAEIQRERELAIARWDEVEEQEEHGVCPTCEGDRYIERMVDAGRSNSAGYPIPEYRRELCPECDGTGRRAG